jgi:hypothetical protein
VQFTIRSPLSPSECRDRLAKSMEGPIPSVSTRLMGWHVFGRATANRVEATIVGVKVGPDGQKRPSLRPLLRAQLAPADKETVVTGDITSRYNSGTSRISGIVAPVAILVCALWALASLSTRWPILFFDGLLLAMVSFAWFSRRRLKALGEECDRELFAWLERTVEGEQDSLQA